MRIICSWCGNRLSEYFCPACSPGAKAGRDWIGANPKASDVEIEAAATKFSPFNPARRHFYNAAKEVTMG